MQECTAASYCCQIRKKTNAAGTKSTIIGIGCLVTLPSSGLVYQDRLCILTKYIKLPQISFARECFAVFHKDKKISLKPDRYLESCPKLGFTLIACEQAKVLKDDTLKPFSMTGGTKIGQGRHFLSVRVTSENSAFGFAYSNHVVSHSLYSHILFASSPRNANTMKLIGGGPLLSTDGKELIGMYKNHVGSGLCISAIIHQLHGFRESDGTEEIMRQLTLLECDEINLDKDQLKISACQALSKLTAKSVEDLECLVTHPDIVPTLLSLPDHEPNVGVLGATCKLLTIITSPNTLTYHTRDLCEDIVHYVLNAMSFSQHATVHLFGCRVLLNLITSESKDSVLVSQEQVDIRTVILEQEGASVLRRVVRCHRDDKHIQHTVCLLLSMLLEYTYRGWQDSEIYREHCVDELQNAQELLSKAGDGLHHSQLTYEQDFLDFIPPDHQFFVTECTRLSRVEAELAWKISEQEQALKQKSKVIENRDETIEQLQRRLEFSSPPRPSQSSTSDNSNWKEKLVAEREQWEMQRAELCASLDLSQDLVREMASALQKVKLELEVLDQDRIDKRVDYSTWHSVKEELERMGKGIASLGSLAEQELCYHYDIIDVAGEEDAQLHETIQNLSDKADKKAELRKFARTHSQTSLDISMDTENKANKTLDKVQMVRKAIHSLEQTLEDEEVKVEKLRQNRFIRPLEQVDENQAPNKITEVDIHNMPRGLIKHLCRMLDEAPECGWRKCVPLMGMSHRLKDIEKSLDSPTAELIRVWTNENKLVTFADLVEILRTANQTKVVDFIKRHLQLKKRLSKQSFMYFPMDN